jgi:hypothetical protein
MNDRIFETEIEALAFAATLNKPPMTVCHDDSLGDFDVAEMDAYWRSLEA